MILRLILSGFLGFLFFEPVSAQQAVSSCLVRDPNLQGSYEGDCIAGVASGKGRAIGKDRYEGGFRDGRATGYGIYTRADGRRLEGDFLDGVPSGRVRIYYTTGDVLDALFESGRLVGRGRLTPRAGDSFEVEARDGKLVRVAASPTVSSQPPSSALPAQSVTPAGDVKWSPRLDLDDLFPSYILASATRKDPVSPVVPQFSRNDPLSVLAAVLQVVNGGAPPVPQGGAKYIGDRWGLIGLGIKTVEPNSEIIVEINVDEVAEPTVERFRIDTPGDYLLYPKLRWKYEKLRGVFQPTPINIMWKVTVNGRLVGSQMKTATLRSIFDAPIHVQTARGATDLSWVFAGYVTEDAPWIDQLLKEALQGRFVRQFDGYGSGPGEARRQVESIYNILQRRGIRYSSVVTSSQASARVMSQVVRFPLDSIRNTQANCIDGTVLMASVLRKIGLDAYIILGPGHAMLGYSTTGDPQQGLTIVETTMIGTARFGDAVRAGSEKFQEWMALHRQDPQFKVISVRNLREQGVMPIPR